MKKLSNRFFYFSANFSQPRIVNTVNTHTMQGIISEIRSSLARLMTVRMHYILNQDRLQLNHNQKLHDLIYYVYTVIAPEKLVEILQTLSLVPAGDVMEEFELQQVAGMFDLQDYVIDIREVFANCDEKQRLIELCHDLTFFVMEAEHALNLLETTL